MQRFPQSFKIMLTKTQNDQPCGIWFKMDETIDNTSCPGSEGSDVGRVLVAGVQEESLVGVWNRRAVADGQHHLVVTPGLELASVCGFKGNAEGMKKELKSRTNLVILFKRPVRNSASKPYSLS